MKLYTPDNTDLIEITAIEPHADGLLIEGRIMGTMPMKAILGAAEMRRAFRLLSLRTLLAIIALPFRRGGKSP
jgi:hypothetical protein